jgi:hypothetical protein
MRPALAWSHDLEPAVLTEAMKRGGRWARAGLQSGATEGDREVKNCNPRGLGVMTRLSIIGIKVPVY